MSTTFPYRNEEYPVPKGTNSATLKGVDALNMRPYNIESNMFPAAPASIAAKHSTNPKRCSRLIILYIHHPINPTAMIRNILSISLFTNVMPYAMPLFSTKSMQNHDVIQCCSPKHIFDLTKIFIVWSMTRISSISSIAHHPCDTFSTPLLLLSCIF